MDKSKSNNPNEEIKSGTSKAHNSSSHQKTKRRIKLIDNITVTNCIKDMTNVFDKTINSSDNETINQHLAPKRRKITNLKLKTVIKDISEVIRSSEQNRLTRNIDTNKELTQESRESDIIEDSSEYKWYGLEEICKDSDSAEVEATSEVGHRKSPCVNQEMSNLFKLMHSTLAKALYSKNEKKEDELDLYGRYLAMKLRQLPPDVIDAVMFQIDESFLKYLKKIQNKSK